MSESFTHVMLPQVNKRVLRLGIAGNYGLDESDLLHAAERGAGLWLYNSKFKHITRALKQILPGQRDQHVVATLGIVAYTGGMVRRAAENALRSLQIAKSTACTERFTFAAARSSNHTASAGVTDLPTTSLTNARICRSGLVVSAPSSIRRYWNPAIPKPLTPTNR